MAIRDVNDICVKRAAGTFQTFPERRNGLVVGLSLLVDAQSIRIIEWFLLSYLFHDHKESDDVTHLHIVQIWIKVGHSRQTVDQLHTKGNEVDSTSFLHSCSNSNQRNSQHEEEKVESLQRPGFVVLMFFGCPIN